jgi:Flp pilus assembly pilin Flp
MIAASSRFLTNENGAGVLEYALLLAVVSLALVVQLLAMKPDFCDLSTRVAQLLSSPGAPASCAGNPIGGGGNGNGGGVGGGGGTGGPGGPGVGGGNGNGNGGGRK